MNECIIYGAGAWGEKAYNQYCKKIKILFFVDSDENKWGKSLCNIPIKSPKEIMKHKNAFVLVAIKYGNNKILKSIKKMGLKRVENYIPNIDQLVGIKFDEKIRDKPSILIDTMIGYKRKHPTGMERLLGNITYELKRLEKNIYFIINYNGNILIDTDIDENLYDDRLKEKYSKKISILPKDKILFATTGVFGFFHEMVDEFKCKEVKIYVIIYDMYNFYKSHAVADGSRKLWIKNFLCALHCASGILCYSKTVADEIERYYRREKVCRDSELRLFLFPLGAKLKRVNEYNNIRKEMHEVFRNEIVFLMVGSLRKHKGYSTVLNAFCKYFPNSNVNLIIIGQCISKTDEEVRKEIVDATSKMKNIVWINDATDEELIYCYEHSSALIAASAYEGYGLPLIEAAQYGVPIICSDIPIFREVSCGYADFFDVGDSDSLGRVIKKWIADNDHPDSRKIPIHTWKESAETVLNIMEEKAEPYLVLK